MFVRLLYQKEVVDRVLPRQRDVADAEVIGLRRARHEEQGDQAECQTGYEGGLRYRHGFTRGSLALGVGRGAGEMRPPRPRE